MGFETTFLGDGLEVALPAVDPSLEADLVRLDGTPVIDYTHFSLAMSRSRRARRLECAPAGRP